MDVLFGERRFTGRLSMTWPRTEDQVPINIGDDDYDPSSRTGGGSGLELSGTVAPCPGLIRTSPATN